uniref:Uncharacterized protein n=1 Tax=viral metagenome TaxID=1070528 RepID=A0A6C0DE10_9ZZZZ
MSEGADIKSVMITGGAITEGGKIKRTRKSTTKKNKQEGGDPVGSPLMAPDTKTFSIGMPATPCPIPSVSTALPSVALAPVSAQAPVSAPASAPAPAQAPSVGGAKVIKVELKKRPTAKKVQLHPKKADAPKTPLVKKNLTKKARKISLGISALHMKMKSAKKTHKRMKEMPLDKLKEELIKKKLIKATSKAPEVVLRQIAADAQVLEDKAL